MKKYTYIIILVPILLLVSAGLISNSNSYRFKIDGLAAELFDLIEGTDTKYSENYSHCGFNEIKIGMTENEAIEILGEPLIRWKPYKHSKIIEKEGFIGLQYSESPSSTHYRLRQIYINNGEVAKIIGYMYID